MTDPINNTFETDNFQLASYILSQSCMLLMVKKDNPKRVVFVFEESPERERLTQEFLSYQGSVEPHKYFSAQKDLKQLIYR
ncbi:hypothetical protein A2862_03345 [Candidatus Roizmanbacteria bacterium RIFCSPHIGHO2_01_FULL_38_41]|nr:MAG: hypothetical protein A2862_03345 [Candidatus Roizmanbacteria bacterium RIFCSPHIGHO2_01_FULL_38_41]OGK33118.1 MAG: hypothetical protein A3E10_00935 [Candidatus Roizmanbacteria bacterium RIFCSPHIGHO2_12_FULL_37_23]